MDNGDKTLRSFWQRKEGTAGMVTLAALGLGGLFALKALLPTIVEVLTLGTIAIGQLWMATLLCVGLAFTLWVLFGTKLPALVMYWFKIIVRKATSVFVATYPIEIMKEFIAKMQLKKQVFSEKKTDVKKQERVLRETIGQNDRERKDALAKMKAAQSRGMDMEVSLAARSAGRLEEINARHASSLAQIELLYKRLERVEQVCDYKIRDMQDQVKVLEQDHKITKATKSALNAARAILSGTDPDQELYDMAVENVVEEYRMTMGDLDDFMVSTESVMNGIDLQNGMWEQKALDQLAVLEQKEQALIGHSTPTTLPAFNNAGRVVEAEVIPLPSQDYSSKYFK